MNKVVREEHPIASGVFYMIFIINVQGRECKVCEIRGSPGAPFETIHARSILPTLQQFDNMGLALSLPGKPTKFFKDINTHLSLYNHGHTCAVRSHPSLQCTSEGTPASIRRAMRTAPDSRPDMWLYHPDCSNDLYHPTSPIINLYKGTPKQYHMERTFKASLTKFMQAFSHDMYVGYPTKFNLACLIIGHKLPSCPLSHITYGVCIGSCIDNVQLSCTNICISTCHNITPI